jgi:Bacterial PH domain
MSRRREKSRQEPEPSKKLKLPRLSLQKGESVVMVARPARLSTFQRYLYTGGLYGLWRKRNTSVVTSRRVLMGRGIFNRTERSIPIDHVDDVVFVRRGLSAYADMIITAGERTRVERIGPLGAKAARQITAEILDRR